MGGFLRSNWLRTLHASRPNVPGPGAAQPPASVRPRPRAPHALAATTTSDAPREAPAAERFGGWVHRRTLALATYPWRQPAVTVAALPQRAIGQSFLAQE